MNICLVAIHTHRSPQAVPLANGFLKAYLLTYGKFSSPVDVTLLDCFLDDPVEECVSAILATQADAVGFSMYLWNREKCGKIAAAVRSARPRALLFAGGPEPTACTKAVLTEELYDFVITGEGEIPFLHAVERLQAGLPLTGINGIIPGEAADGTVQELPPDLAAIPSPYLSGVLDPAALPGVLWQLSRGCQFACDFCYDHRTRHGVRRFQLERIQGELDLFARSGVAQVFVLASTFNHDVNFAKEVLRLLAAKAPHIHFHFEIRSEFLDAEMASLFARVNCSLQIGLQSVDPAVQKKVHRAFNASHFAEKVSLLNESGAIFGFDLIYGLPGDTLAGFADSLDFALALYPNHLDIFPLAVLPGTALSHKAASLGLQSLSAPPYTVSSSPTFPAADMKEAARLAAGCDIFYSRGKCVAWFNTVVAPLRMKGSEFLRSFIAWAGTATGNSEIVESDLSDEEIHALQRNFLQHLYGERGQERLTAAALDLVDYHYLYAAALLAPAPELPTDRELERTDLLSSPLALASSTRLATFSYEIFDILESGDIDLEEFTDCFSPTGSCAAIYPRAGDVYTESLDPRFFSLLQRLDGISAAAPHLAELGLREEEAVSFLEFAAAEGIVILARLSAATSP